MKRFLLLFACLPLAFGCAATGGPGTPGAPPDKSPAELVCETPWTKYVEAACPLIAGQLGEKEKKAHAICFHTARALFHAKKVVCIGLGTIEPEW